MSVSVCGITKWYIFLDIRNKEMVSVTEQYIFVKPFTDNDPTNKHDPLLNKEVEKLRHESTKCCQRAEEMRKVFVECQDCFCHGDLHTGSVMIGDGCSKVSCLIKSLVNHWNDRNYGKHYYFYYLIMKILFYLLYKSINS